MTCMSGAQRPQSHATLRAVIVAAICIQAAQGVFDVSLPLRAESAGLSATAFGWTGAAHSFGFLIGALIAPIALKRLGAYGVLVAACLMATPLFALGWTSAEGLWLPTRLGAGFSFAIMFAATDTAVVDTASTAQRARAIGVYVMFERLAMVIMPFAFATRLAAPATIGYGVACLWIALIPGRILLQSHPPQKQARLKLWSTFNAARRLAPNAVLCAFAAGALNTSTLVLLPRWVHGQLGDWAVPVVQAAAWSGALTVQLGVGFLAGPRIRRELGIWLTPFAAATFVSMPAAAHAGLLFTALAALVIGASAFSQYGLALMALSEVAALRQRPPPTAALVFAWGLGAVGGPMSCSALGLYAHPISLFLVVAILWLIMSLASLAMRLRVVTS